VGDARRYRLEELAREAGISPRTVRYYVQRGLLPAPVFRGKDTAYDEDHLVRLRAIRRMQEAFFPLDAIASDLAGLSRQEVQRIADAYDSEAAVGPKSDPEPPAARPILGGRTSSTASAAEGTARGSKSGAGRRASLDARTFERIELAPGVELSVASDVSDEARRLVERILTEVLGT
jgi:DNA-binding transcriptional MerR regulator